MARFVAPENGKAPEVAARIKSGELVVVKRYRHFDVQILESADKSAIPALRQEVLGGQLKLGLADRIVSLAATPNDPRLVDNPFFTPTMSDADTHLEAAWDRITDASAVTVAIMDTGMDFTHPDLAPNVWVNPVEANGSNGVDDDGNGYVDDISGYDFVANTPTFGDGDGHGTRVAGVVGSRGDNGVGVVNTTWQVGLVPLRIFGTTTTTLELILDGFDYCLGLGEIDIINASFGFLNDPMSSTDAAEIEALRTVAAALDSAGILLVAASGNEGVNIDSDGFYPASLSTEFDNVISVAAIDTNGFIASFGGSAGSNYGTTVSVAAPGKTVLSTILGSTAYGFVQGTSFSSPFVAGGAALALAANPQLTPADLKFFIVSTSRSTAALSPTPMGGGLIDFDALLRDSSGQVNTTRDSWQVYN